MRTLFLVLQVVLFFVSTGLADPFDFDRIVIDNNYHQHNKPGWSRMADVDQDGVVDVVAGGGNYLGWYKAPDWEAFRIGAAGCNGGALFDVDRDGDLDVITAVKSEGNRTFWFENPFQGYPDAERKEGWNRYPIDTSDDLTFQHDLETGDIDMDGTPDDLVVLHDNYRRHTATIKWYRIPGNPKTDRWEIFTIARDAPGGVGLAIGDIDNDGRNDIVRGGKWYAAPDTVGGSWTEHLISDTHFTNVRVKDIDLDGDLDIAAAAGWEDLGPVVWMENQNHGARFEVHEIATLYHPENMVVLDLDFDGDYELITGEMRENNQSNLLVFEQKNLRRDLWTRHTISDGHGISARMNAYDVDKDGDDDIVCDGNAESHIYLWKNTSDRKFKQNLSFEYFNLDSEYAPGWIREGDMDNDGDIDIVSGGGRKMYIYENNGQARGWKRYGTLDGTGLIGCNAAALYDMDNDGDLDIFAALYYRELGWWENPGELQQNPWKYHTFLDTEDWYLHDLEVFDIDQDGREDEFVVNLNSGYWKSNLQLKWFTPTADSGTAEIHVIEPERQESFHGHAGLGFGDVNGDGRPDVSYANGWYEAPDDITTPWTWHAVTSIYGISNNLPRDVNQDGRMDLIMAAGHHFQGVYWFEQTDELLEGTFKQHTIDPTAHHPEGMQSVDLDQDGDLDVIACELYFGEFFREPDWDEDVHNVFVYLNRGKEPHRWVKINIAPNRRPAHSLRMADVNQDGKPDIIAESSGAPGVIYIENQSR